MAEAQDPLSPKYSGYVRAGSGMSTKGGDQECFSNQGASANEFRLGNECEIYGELGARLNGFRQGDVFFDVNFRVAAVSPGHSSYEGPNEQFHLVEAFVEAGGFDDSKTTYWGGKRFYREHQIQMYDWYYFGNTSGNGAGVSGLKTSNGQIDLALIIETGSRVSNKGRHAVQLVDFRWRNLKVGPTSKIELWLGYARAMGGVSSATQYDPSQGWLVGGLWQFQRTKGFDELALLHGRRLLQSLSVYGDPAPISGISTQSALYRWRAVYYGGDDAVENWAWQRALVYENWNSGRWMSVGMGPVYFVSDHVQIASTLGSSVVEDWGGRTRHLTRVTVAPQLAPARSHWSRPALRVFYTQSWWNSANQSFVGQGAPAYQYERSGGAVGFQVEHWF